MARNHGAKDNSDQQLNTMQVRTTSSQASSWRMKELSPFTITPNMKSKEKAQENENVDTSGRPIENQLG